jgi:hypothetical protein
MVSRNKYYKSDRSIVQKKVKAVDEIGSDFDKR